MSGDVSVENSIHEEWEELVALAALDGLPEAELRRVLAHLDECARCQSSYTAYRHVADSLALSVPVVEAPPTLEEKIRQAVKRSPAPPSRRLRRPRFEPSMWVALAALLVGLLLGLQNWSLRQEIDAIQRDQAAMSAALVSPRAEPILLEPRNGEAAGRFVWARGNPIASLLVEGLPPNRTYRLWLIRKDGVAEEGGLLVVGADGRGQLTVDAPSPWSTYSTLGISESLEWNEDSSSEDFLLEGNF